MILYNTLIGVAAGAAMILVAAFARLLAKAAAGGSDPGSDGLRIPGWAAAFGALGLLLVLLAGALTITWPLKAKPPVNILFGEPPLFLGVLLLATAALLWRTGGVPARGTAESDDDAPAGARRLLGQLGPLAWLTSCLGLVLLSCGIAVLVFDATGSAPPQEPVSASLPNGVENTLIAVMFLVAAAGCLPAPWALSRPEGPVARACAWCLTVGGALVLLYSALNYYTHIGYLVRAG